MKQRNIFAVFILSIVTLGIYFLIWLYEIHRDLLKKIEDKKSLPSFWWLFVPVALLIACIILSIVLTLTALLSGPPADNIIIAVAAPLIAILVVFAPLVIGFWWFYRFCQVFYKVVGGTETTVSYALWIVSLCMCLPIWTLIVQGDINKSLESEQPEAP